MNGRNRFETVDLLRGLASLSVVCFHYVGLLITLHVPLSSFGNGIVWITRYGYLGVPVFFALSGFVIEMTAERYTFTPRVARRFLVRRLVRIVPPYWAIVTLTVVAILAGKVAGLYRQTTLTAPQVLSHYVYLQDILGYPVLNEAFWTLCLEVQFYLAFAVLAVTVHRCGPGVRPACAFAMTLVSLAIDLMDAIPAAWWPRLWYQFGAGVLAFSATHQRGSRGLCFVAAAGIFTVGCYRGTATDVTVALTMVFLVFFGASDGRRCPKAFLFLGRISYSLYLVHVLAGDWMGQVTRRLNLEIEPLVWAAIGLEIVIAVAVAAVFYRFCEKPAVEWSRRIRIQ